MTKTTRKATSLADRALIAVSGDEAGAFLHAVLSADIAGLAAGRGTCAALLTPQGKVIADLLVFNASDGAEGMYLLDCGVGFVSALLDGLSAYRLRRAVNLTQIEAPNGVYAVFSGDKGHATPHEGLFEAPHGEAFYTFADPRSAQLGARLYGPQEAIEAALGDTERALPEGYHALRVALGIGEGGKDYATLSVFPHEINFDRLGGVDFKKGCYIGQEVVSRMEHRGTTRTRLVRVAVQDGIAPLAGSDVMAGALPIGQVGEAYGGQALALIRLDRAQDAQAKGIPITASGVALTLLDPIQPTK